MAFTNYTNLAPNFNSKKPLKVNTMQHPLYTALYQCWYKWRLTYEGGEEFKRVYLKPFSARESVEMFCQRREISYIPAFAKTGINEIRNSIFQRLTDITRSTTSVTYNEAVEGKNGGVDRQGSTMEQFLGTEILKELLVMRKVGIYVDNTNIKATNYAQSIKQRPYLYMYKAEQIISWHKDDYGRFDAVLLQDNNYECDDNYYLPIGDIKQYRYYWIDDTGYVRCQFYDANGDPKGSEIQLLIPQIPFHVAELSSSLMEDVADYQISLMNIASSDVQFARLANYPLYVEQFDVQADMIMNAMQGKNGLDSHPETDGSQDKSEQSSALTRIGGNLHGRRIAKDLDFPQWVAPDTSPLVSSMEKQRQMKEEIRTLLFLSLGNLQATRQSADSKQADVHQEENGLSYIGFELSLAENRICEFWHSYENNNKPFNIKYPQTYNIRTTKDRIDEATGYIKLLQVVDSLSYKKELLKRIARALLGGQSSYETMNSIYAEIDKLDRIVDPEQLIIDLENRLVSHELASKYQGYPDGECDKANEEATEHATAIIEAQAEAQPPTPSGKLENPAARGLPELSSNPKEDIQNDRNKNKPYKPRGKGKSPSKTGE